MASKYKDPAPVKCPRCAVRSSYRVADLLELEARCASCHEPLIQTGIEMRNGLDEWATFVAKLVMTERLAEYLGLHFSDNELDGIKTLRDLSGLIAARLERTTDASSARAIELTKWAVAELERHPLWGHASHSTFDFDVPLLDVLDPGRWDYSDTSPRHLVLRRICN